ncbi:MAG TPA: MFS transporter [Pseudonocardiaceae bacterium]|nr:MFS transporter [Pseudonocardiaceae bacterium]
MGDAGPARSAGFRDVLAVGEFRVLFAAQLVSVAGDQLARVALSVLVYERTRSPAWTAATYAMTFLPDLVGGPLLSGIADRRPRRTVMVTADVLRTVLVLAMVPAGAPLWLVGALVAVVQVFNTPWGAARAALLTQILVGERYVVGQAMFNVATQTAQVVGFGLGGVLVAGLGPHGALAVDAATFAGSAVLVRFGVRHRPAAMGVDQATRGSWWGQVSGGVALVWTSLRLRALVALACVSGIYIAAEALAAPYAAGIGVGAVAVGMLFAAYPTGAVLGMALLPRWSAQRRLRWMVPMAMLSCAPLIGCVVRVGLVPTLALWTAGGVASAYNLTASTAFVQAVPNARRGQAFGLAVTAMRVTQGIGVVIAGVAAQRWPPHLVVAGAGVVGVVAAAGAGWWWHASLRQGTTSVSSPVADRTRRTGTGAHDYD